MTAKNALVARQPIFDRNVNVRAYEILFRSSGQDEAQFSSADCATAEVGVNAVLDIGLDRLVGNHVAWINIPRNVLVNGLYEFFPPERVVLELLETIEADSEVLAAIERAKSLGFQIALDDFVLNGRTRALVPLADFVKLDVLASSDESIQGAMRELRAPGLRLLAEKVESHAAFQRMNSLGCELFQGYFFAQPQLLEGRKVPNNRMSLLRVVASLQDADASLEAIEDLIRGDVGLSYRLMRYVNSVGVGMLAPIHSLRHAIMTLGFERVRACVMVLMLSACDDKPDELVTTSLVRARYCQLLCGFTGLDPQRGFLVGLMSAIDAFLDRELEGIVLEMGFSEDIVSALVAHEGQLGLVLESAIACESAEQSRLGTMQMQSAALRESYLDALSWSAQMQASLIGP